MEQKDDVEEQLQTEGLRVYDVVVSHNNKNITPRKSYDPEETRGTETTYAHQPHISFGLAIDRKSARRSHSTYLNACQSSRRRRRELRVDSSEISTSVTVNAKTPLCFSAVVKLHSQ